MAHFQREVVRLQFKKVLLQKSLRDEHDKVCQFRTGNISGKHWSVQLVHTVQRTFFPLVKRESLKKPHKPVVGIIQPLFFVDFLLKLETTTVSATGQGGAGPWCASRRRAKSQEQRESSGDLDCFFLLMLLMVLYVFFNVFGVDFVGHDVFIHEGCSWKGWVSGCGHRGFQDYIRVLDSRYPAEQRMTLTVRILDHSKHIFYFMMEVEGLISKLSPVKPLLGILQTN